MRPTMAWGVPPEEARERRGRRSRRQARASRPDDRSQPVIPGGFAEYPARLVHATNAHFAFDRTLAAVAVSGSAISLTARESILPGKPQFANGGTAADRRFRSDCRLG